VAELDRVRTWAHALIELHLDPSWSFAFDNARTRAGLCNYTAKRISVSRHMALLSEDDEVHQVLLHEVAHALVGKEIGHGPRWRAVAADLGYAGGRTFDGPIAKDLAPWLGTCPAGHEIHRHRRPTKPMSCGRCSRRFDPAHLIRWVRR